MRIDFNSIPENEIKSFQGGEGSVLQKLFKDDAVKIMMMRVRPGCTVGLHTHGSNREIEYIVSGHGKAICDGKEELLEPGVCHYCPRGSSHTVICEGDEDLVFFAVVPEL